jgi:hypothetical protein
MTALFSGIGLGGQDYVSSVISEKELWFARPSRELPLTFPELLQELPTALFRKNLICPYPTLPWATRRRFDPSSSPSASLAEAVHSPNGLIGN